MAAAVDANVFIHGRGDFDFGKINTVPEVLEEIESGEGRNVLENTDYSVEEPSPGTVEKVREISGEINSPTSEADERLVALALEKGYTVVSDDMAVQNLALHLDVEAEGFLDTAVVEKYRWEKVCDTCGADFSGSSCSRCGSGEYRLKQVRCSSG